MNGFDRTIAALLPGGLRSESINTLQVNLGRTCNLTCTHCHLECSPLRHEQMPETVMAALLSLTGRMPFRLIDITGGAPELHPRFRLFVEELCEPGPFGPGPHQSDDSSRAILEGNRFPASGPAALPWSHRFPATWRRMSPPSGAKGCTKGPSPPSAC